MIRIGLVMLLIAVALPAPVDAQLSFLRGDANNDGVVNTTDVLYLGQYLFGRGPLPLPELGSGDANCDSRVDIRDAIYIVNYTMRSGPEPRCPTF